MRWKQKLERQRNDTLVTTYEFGVQDDTTYHRLVFTPDKEEMGTYEVQLYDNSHNQNLTLMMKSQTIEELYRVLGDFLYSADDSVIRYTPPTDC